MAPIDEPQHGPPLPNLQIRCPRALIVPETQPGLTAKQTESFKVADTVFAERRVRNCTNAQWEAALRNAKQRTKAGERPVIKSSDF